MPTGQPARVNLTNGPIRCTINTTDPLPADAYGTIIAPLAEAIEQAVAALDKLGVVEGQEA
jgi:hypothetical protein